jgi:transposase
MKYTQNEKILQITDQTLIIGVDVASEIHHARAFDNRGIELSKIFRFSNDIEGFEAFTSWIMEIKQKHHKQQVTVGMEPTGHYWFTLAQHLKEHGIRIVLVNPMHVKRSKEMDDNNPTKNDRKDPKTIAMLVKDGRYMEPYIDHDEVIANVSVSELQMLIEGQEVSALQIGTVMTHPEYRGKGLARKLMECVIC